VIKSVSNRVFCAVNHGSEFVSDAGSHRTAILCGLSAAVLAATVIYSHWIIVVLVATCSALLAIFENELFLLTTVFCIPLASSMQVGSPLHDLPGALRFLTALSFLCGRVLRNDFELSGLIRSPISRLSLGFLTVTIASFLIGSAVWTQFSSHSLYRLISYLAFFYFIASWADCRLRIVKVLRVLLYSTIATSGFALLQELVKGYTSFWLFLYPPNDTFIEWEGRATSFLGYSNSLAGYLNLLLPLALAFSVVGNNSWKRLGRGTCVMGLVALISTQSVGALAAFVVIIGMAIVRFATKRRDKITLFSVLCVLLCVSYLLRTILNPSHSSAALGPDATIRVVLWSIAWGFFKSSPLLGVGWGNFVGLYGSYTSSFSSMIPAGVFAVHNIYLQLLAETGIIGLVVFLCLMRKSWQLGNALRTSDDFVSVALAFGIQGAIVSVLVHGLVDFLFQVSPQFGSLFWGLVAIGVAMERLNRARSVISIRRA